MRAGHYLLAIQEKNLKRFGSDAKEPDQDLRPLVRSVDAYVKVRGAKVLCGVVFETLRMNQCIVHVRLVCMMFSLQSIFHMALMLSNLRLVVD